MAPPSGQATAIQRGKALLATGAREEAALVLEEAAARAAHLKLIIHEVRGQHAHGQHAHAAWHGVLPVWRAA